MSQSARTPTSTSTQDPPRYGRLRRVRPLRDFLTEPQGPAQRWDRFAVVDQALTVLSGFYVHLPVKRAMYVIDPEAELIRLRRRLETAGDPDAPLLTEREFHDRMIDVFTSLRDLHTTYVLPEPWRSHVAFLPFLIEEAYDEPWNDDEDAATAARRFLVTKIGGDRRLRPGDEVTHWNGVPIALAIERSAQRHLGGGNVHARRARGLERLTYRWLGGSRLPDEDWVVLTVARDGRAPRDVRVTWLVGALPPDGGEASPHHRAGAVRRGMDPEGEAARRVKRDLFAPRGRAPRDQLLRYRRWPDADAGEYGYLRIYSFDADDVDAFLARIARLLRRAPRGGLIVDVRGNPGGDIGAGERLLQLFTPGTITPEPLHFRATPLTRQLATQLRAAGEWIPEAVIGSITDGLFTGTPFSRGAPLLPQAASNDLGQVYQGPVVLIVDALSYSTTDIVAAGVQDHPRGRVLGTSGRTGAGGANGASSEVLRSCMADGDATLAALADGPSFQVAIRRTTRVGGMADVVLEDAGVTPQWRYNLTREDVLGRNDGLLAEAARILDATGPAPRLAARRGRDGALRLTTDGLTRVELVADGAARVIADPRQTKLLQTDGLQPPFDLLGYDERDDLVVSLRIGAT